MTGFSNVEYLVRPYQDSRYLLTDGGEHIVRNPFRKIATAIRNHDMHPNEYLTLMQRKWIERIQCIRVKMDALFVVVNGIAQESQLPQLVELLAFAKRELGDRYITVMKGCETVETFLTRGVELLSPLSVAAYGEISDRCATFETKVLIKYLRAKYRTDMEVRLDFLRELCPDTLEGKFN